VGNRTARRSSAGITAFNDLPGNRKIGPLTISDVTVSGFRDGIAVGGGRGQSGFRDVHITGAAVHGNLDAGLIVYGPAGAAGYANDDVSITRVAAFGNYGDPRDTRTNSGNGIVIGSTRDAVVYQSAAYRNGGRGASAQGPAGIWAYDSTRVDIVHCVSYRNRAAHLDGNGFGLDENTTDSSLEYDLSYGNDGAGYLVLAQTATAASTATWCGSTSAAATGAAAPCSPGSPSSGTPASRRYTRTR
jgi:hypothetical protein